jgi:hypothetical protein
MFRIPAGKVRQLSAGSPCYTGIIRISSKTLPLREGFFDGERKIPVDSGLSVWYNDGRERKLLNGLPNGFQKEITAGLGKGRLFHVISVPQQRRQL